MDVFISDCFSQLVQNLTFSLSCRQLFHKLNDIVQYLGFDYYAYSVHAAFPVSNPSFVFYSNYPDEWKKKYAKNNYPIEDPTIIHGLKTSLPLIWRANEVTKQKNFWENAFTHKIRCGWTQSAVLNPHNTAVFTMACKKQIDVSHQLQSHLLTLSATFHNLYTKVVLAEVPDINLTKREIEILKWCSDGKTSEEIAMILNVKKRTISFHIANAINKLNVNNKTSAAVRAVQLKIP
ncbi:autoinducer binding domain-containing protein [Neptunicella sp.]|uniref:autoinducer binding domain-containing protein n=1 Tax=Neptunicella sp. TaxID=2125986 RepID=UPI003F6902B6